MLALGRAIMARPKLVLLDEPSLGLAPMLVKEIFDRLERMITDEGRPCSSSSRTRTSRSRTRRARTCSRSDASSCRGRATSCARRVRPTFLPGLLMLVAAFTWTEFAQQIVAGLRQGAVFAG
jgi:hypothetical protein